MTEIATSLTVLTTEIIAAYVENNRVEVDALPILIKAVYGALNGLGVDVTEVEPEEPKPTASQVRKSITDAGLVSFIDGKTYQTLKRHIGRHDMTPDDYRARYGLSADYPIVAPAYAARRSELAKAIGLGTKPRQRMKPRKKA
ncbi:MULTISPECIES: MucR family transcriptional regulator [Brevundimonas]|uniref:MucR family transcriptional regulator n=1 Tax=Brevundimonas TaxID=41275 RepID=UPI0025B9466B|nr:MULTISPECIES: MucR family transcriptional regulator [Brevundimonas]